MRIVSVTGLAVLLSASAALAAETAADKFVGEIVGACALSPTVKQVRANLSARFVPANKTPATALPKALAGFLGEPVVERKEDYVVVRLPIKATAKGLKVERVSFAIGQENGIDSQVVSFAASLDQVEAKFGDTVRKIRAKGQDGTEVMLMPEGDTTDFVCDHSM